MEVALRGYWCKEKIGGEMMSVVVAVVEELRHYYNNLSRRCGLTILCYHQPVVRHYEIVV